MFSCYGGKKPHPTVVNLLQMQSDAEAEIFAEFVLSVLRSLGPVFPPAATLMTINFELLCHILEPRRCFDLAVKLR